MKACGVEAAAGCMELRSSLAAGGRIDVINNGIFLETKPKLLVGSNSNGTNEILARSTGNEIF